MLIALFQKQNIPPPFIRHVGSCPRCSRLLFFRVAVTVPVAIVRARLLAVDGVLLAIEASRYS
jgi:hypothetical protein